MIINDASSMLKLQSQRGINNKSMGSGLLGGRLDEYRRILRVFSSSRFLKLTVNFVRHLLKPRRIYQFNCIQICIQGVSESMSIIHKSFKILETSLNQLRSYSFFSRYEARFIIKYLYMSK